MADKKYLDDTGQFSAVASGPAAPAYTLPAATAAALGGVKQAAAVANVGASADAAALTTTVNALLAALRASGALAS